MSDAVTTVRADLKILGVALAVVMQVWPLLLFLSLIMAAALVWAAATGDTAPLPVAWWVFSAGVAGLAGSFALHEAAHAVVLKRIPTVTAVTVQRALGRTSLLPHGHMTGRQAMAVAVAGPAACVAVGAVLAALDPTAHLSWWYLGHGLFVLPVFGDGMAILKGIRTGRHRINAER